jgi:hypothetical protein
LNGVELWLASFVPAGPATPSRSRLPTNKEITMADNIEPVTIEVEVHGAVLDLQGLGKDMDKSEMSCISFVSSFDMSTKK